MYSSRTGQCQAYNTATQLATPFVRQACFEPAYLPNGYRWGSEEPAPVYQAHLPSMDHTDRGCGVDTHYGPGVPNVLSPLHAFPYDARGSNYRRSNSYIVGYAPRDYQAPDGSTCPQQPYYVRDDKNQLKVVCPILTAETVRPGCTNCLTNVFQCERLKEVDPVAFEKCEKYRKMIHFGIVTPHGYQIPFGIEMDGEGLEVWRAAVQKCGVACGSCAVNYPAQDFVPPATCTKY